MRTAGYFATLQPLPLLTYGGMHVYQLKKRMALGFPLAELLPHPDNPKLHDEDAMDESLAETGFSGVIVAQESTRYVLDGHGRLKGLLRDGVTHEDVQFLDVDDTLAKKILLSRNKVGRNAGFDDEALNAILAEMAADGELLGTGYNPDEVDDLLAGLGAPIVTEEEEFTGGYVEDEQEAKHRAERKSVTKASTGLREVVLVYKDDDFEDFKRAVAYVSDFHAALSTSEAVLAGMVNYAKELETDTADV